MKLTKSQLKQIIKEELSNIAEGGYMGHYEEPPMEGATDLASEVQRLYDEWQPQTPEGQRYRDDLGELLGTDIGQDLSRPAGGGFGSSVPGQPALHGSDVPGFGK